MRYITKSELNNITFRHEYGMDGEFRKTAVVEHKNGQTTTLFETEERIESTAELVTKLLTDLDLELLPERDLQQDANLILAALVYGVDIKVKYTMVAPYTHGYLVYGKLGEETIEVDETRGVWYKALPERLARQLHENYQKKYGKPFDYDDLKRRVQEKIDNTIAGTTDLVPRTGRNYHRGDIANGYEEGLTKESIRNIINGYHHGSYETSTPSSQNDLAEQLMRVKFDDLADKLTDEDHEIIDAITALDFKF